MAHPKLDFSQLTPEERIQLAEDLWDSLGDFPASAPLSQPQARELDRRLEAYRRDGERGERWQPVLDRIEERLRERGG